MAPPTITVHDAAAIFPMLSDDELAEMGKSIQTHGLREKIHAMPVAHDDRTDWVVLDGRNRMEALRRLGVSDTMLIAEYMLPVNLEVLHATAEEYVMMANIERRNLTQPQRKALAGKLVLMIQEAQKDKPKTEKVDALATAATKAGVSRRTAATAAKQVKSGGATKPKKKTPAKALTASTAMTKLVVAVDTVKKVNVKQWDDVTYKALEKKVVELNNAVNSIGEKRPKAPATPGAPGGSAA